MHIKGFHPVAAAVATAFLVGACTSAGGAPGAAASPPGSVAPSVSPAPPPASSELVLRVAHEGGFVAAAKAKSQADEEIAEREHALELKKAEWKQALLEKESALAVPQILLHILLAGCGALAGET